MFAVLMFKCDTTFGWEENFKKAFETLEEAIVFIETEWTGKLCSIHAALPDWDIVEIVDLNELKVVQRGTLYESRIMEVVWD